MIGEEGDDNNDLQVDPSTSDSEDTTPKGSGGFDTTVSDYFISTRGRYAVIVFQGMMTFGCEEMFNQAIEEIEALTDTRYVVICLRDIDKLDHKGIRFIIKLQMVIRDNHKKLRICNIHHTHKKMLLDAGAIRFSEVKPNITQAIKGFIKSKSIKKKRSRS